MSSIVNRERMKSAGTDVEWSRRWATYCLEDGIVKSTGGELGSFVFSSTAHNAQVLQLYLLQDHPDILWCLDMDR